MKKRTEGTDHKKSKSLINRCFFTKGGSRRLLSIGVSALLFVSTFLTVIPQMSVPVYAAGTGKNLQLGYTVIGENANTNSAATVYFGSQGDPLAWRVIGYNGDGVASSADTATLLASDNIGSSEFDDTLPYSHVYAGSKLQSAVNSIYTNRFTSIEDSNIRSRTLQTGIYSGAEPYTDGVAETAVSDARLWPLSTQEAYYTNSDLRGASDFWWLRSPGDYASIAAPVDRNGDVNYGGYFVYEIVGVRPAFNINLSSIILTSAASGGKDPGTGGAGTLNEVAANTVTAWKLTISDSTRSLFTASAGTGATVSMPEGYTSWTVPITYSRAQTGTNEHVSAILTNSSGVALYYGYIATNSTGGTGNVTIPTGLNEGTYTLNVFNEQCNGNNMTDLSSPIRTIGLTVTEAPQVATPTFSPAAGTYTEAQNVTISCNTAGATIHYTTDGSAPTATSSTYNGPINISETKTIKAIAVKTGMTDSSVASARYTISETPVDTCTITFEPNGGKGDMDDQTVDKGVRTQLNKNKFTRSGYSFDGWNTDPDGDGTGYEDKDYISVQKDITLYAQWERDDHEDDDEDEDDHTPASWILNPNEKQQLSIIFTGTPEGTCAGYQEQGAAAKAVFAAATPRGWSEAFEFNLLNKYRQPEMTLKKGTLTLTIPSEYRKAGRQFALIALTKGGQTILLPDTDTNPNTVTATINVEGYAFSLIYKD